MCTSDLPGGAGGEGLPQVGVTMPVFQGGKGGHSFIPHSYLVFEICPALSEVLGTEVNGTWEKGRLGGEASGEADQRPGDIWEN